MSQVAYIDLSKKDVSLRAIPEELLRQYLGGRGLNAYLLYNHLTSRVEPLSPDNTLIFGAGLLTGHLGISTSRWHVTGKSPETGIYGDSNCGGFWGAELQHAGFQHLVIEGAASEPVYLWVHDGKIELRDASFLWGQDTYETQKLIIQELNDPNIQIACIGPGGEKLVRFACVRHGIKRAAGRTGMGCIMGSKNLKAIAVRGTQGLKVKDSSRLLEILKRHYRQVLSTSNYPIWSRYGTLAAFVMLNELGQICAYNHQFNYFEEAEGKLEAETFDEEYKTASLSCFSCPIHCTHRYRIESGPYKGTWGEGPEWYLMGGFGPNLGNADWDLILVANDLCNRYGIDIGSTASYIGWLMELWQRGIIDHTFTGGLSLEWGNKETVIELIHQIGKREGLGDKLANGWRAVAREIGKGAEQYIPNTKGLTVEACIDRRAYKASTLGESTSNRGYDHLRGIVIYEFFGLSEKSLARIFGRPVSGDLNSWKDKPWMAVWSQRLNSIADSLGLCKFATLFSSAGNLGFEEFCEVTNAVTGWKLTVAELTNIADRVWNMERMFNVRESSIRRDGDMPPKVYYEPHKLGPSKGAKINRDEYEKALDEYYEILGWHKDGTPTMETLTRLKLNHEPSHLL